MIQTSTRMVAGMQKEAEGGGERGNKMNSGGSSYGNDEEATFSFFFTVRKSKVESGSKEKKVKDERNTFGFFKFTFILVLVMVLAGGWRQNNHQRPNEIPSRILTFDCLPHDEQRK
jgi:hypothetical protein